MRYSWALLILLLIAPLSLPAQKGKKPGKAQAQTVTGCLDEKAGDYVLRGDDMLKEIATLLPVGFEKTSFAKFVGHKVSITGQLLTSTDPPTLRVTSVDHVKNIADICEPGEQK